MALVNLETNYSFPNITHENSKLFYSPDAGGTWFLISVPEGSYDIKDINKHIKQSQRRLHHINDGANAPWKSKGGGLQPFSGN